MISFANGGHISCFLLLTSYSLASKTTFLHLHLMLLYYTNEWFVGDK